MKKYTLIILILITATALLHPRTYIICQEGTGAFTTIAAGIDVALDGDTLLVYPGTYYENIDYEGKDIVITSRYGVESDDRSIIRETIIDGNEEGTVVAFKSGETRNAVLNGFTIQNGRASFHRNSHFYSEGGGIFILDSSPVISYCYIENNIALHGGALMARGDANSLLKGNIIRYNHSLWYGAVTVSRTNVEFCSQSLNSVYLNYGTEDIFLSGDNQSSIVLDTLTVKEPDSFNVQIGDSVPENFTLTVNHGKIKPVAADLYVAPDGCDRNSGLSFEEPLQTIAMAMMKIKPDSLQQRTVYVAEGIYSRSLNNNRFPIQLRSFVDIVGADKKTSIFDLEGETYSIYSNNSRSQTCLERQPVKLKSVKIKNFSILNGGNPLGGIGKGAIRIYENTESLTLENLYIAECHTGNKNPVRNGQETVYLFDCKDLTLRNIHTYNNSGEKALRINSQRPPDLHLYAENLRIRKQRPGPLTPNYIGGSGGAVSIFENPFTPPTAIYPTLVNIEITDDVIDNIDPFWQPCAWSNLVISGRYGKSMVVNATIGNNFTAAQQGGGIIFGRRLDNYLINSIVYGNIPTQIVLANVCDAKFGNLTVSHSLIQGGKQGIRFNHNPDYYELHWGEGNIDADPLWVGEEVNPDYPYMLSAESPARNAGTLYIPDFEFPEYDLAGNPRVYGGSIDMGAYEWHPPETYVEDDISPEPEDYNLHNFPNPAVSLGRVPAKRSGASGGERTSTGTTISFNAPEAGNVVIEIYNLKGQFVKRVFDADVSPGEYNVFWDGRDERNRPVATGFYMYHLKFNDQLVATGRCTFIK